ncbi:MAG: RNA polymerase sigma factor [Phenylobacterium sp.]
MSEPVVTPEALYRRHAAEVFRFALHLSANRAEAEDITAETFVHVWSSGRPVRAFTVRAYLFTIAYHLFRRGRGRSQRFAGLDPDVADAAPWPEEAAGQRSELRAVLAAMQMLEPIDRAVLLMHAVHGVPYDEIARAFGISVGAAKVKTHRARKTLRASRGEGYVLRP